MSEGAAPALEAHALTRRFGSVEVLSDVSLTIGLGEVVGLVGENGAGKSTLLSILCGQLTPDSGEVEVAGERIVLGDHLAANKRGIFRAQQDQGLVGSLTVAENIYLGHERAFTTAGLLRRRRMTDAATHHLDRHLHGRVAASDRTDALPLDLRQLVEIVRAFALAELLEIAHPVILLDEPTASLDHDEVVDFMASLARWRGHATFVFVSHRLNEILDCSTHIYVLKDGKVVAARDPGTTDEETLHSLMVGRVRDEAYFADDLRSAEFGSPVLVLDGASAAPAFANVNLSVCAGQIYGVAGVTGSGKSEVARVIAGDMALTGGRITVDGVTLPRRGVPSRRGTVSYGPLDRHAEGVVLGHSIRRNVTLGCRRGVTARAGFVSPKAEQQMGRTSVGDFGIVTPSDMMRVSALSGGNQQKVMLARLVNSAPRVMVVDNPTRGVDVGARRDIYRHLRRLAADGMALLVVSDDLAELTGLADRLGVMKDGALVHVFDDVGAAPPGEDEIVAWMVSQRADRTTRRCDT